MGLQSTGLVSWSCHPCCVTSGGSSSLSGPQAHQQWNRGFPLGKVPWDVLGSPQWWENKAQRGTLGLESLYGALETQPQKEGPLRGLLWGGLRGDPRHRGTSTQPVSCRGAVHSRAKLRPASSQPYSQAQPLRPPLWVALETADPPHPFSPLTSTPQLRLLTSSSLRPRGVLTPFPAQTPTHPARHGSELAASSGKSSLMATGADSSEFSSCL